jgi:hypothetical protein
MVLSSSSFRLLAGKSVLDSAVLSLLLLMAAALLRALWRSREEVQEQDLGVSVGYHAVPGIRTPNMEFYDKPRLGRTVVNAYNWLTA